MDAEGAVGRVHRVTPFLFLCVKLNLRISSPERRRVARAAVESHRRRQVVLMRVKGDVRDVHADGWTSRTSRLKKLRAMVQNHLSVNKVRAQHDDARGFAAFARAVGEVNATLPADRAIDAAAVWALLALADG